ncbi:MAG: T9SS type A sorting domain-containing protein [Flavobacteriales bacterium]|nr:T9SS type A sorting domain-containing protein [Flavobacteriales bacterium]
MMDGNTPMRRVSEDGRPCCGLKARIVVRDLSGRAVATLPMNAGQGRQTWDASSVAPGTYLVEYIIDGQSLHTEKLVIQR